MLLPTRPAGLRLLLVVFHQLPPAELLDPRQVARVRLAHHLIRKCIDLLENINSHSFLTVFKVEARPALWSPQTRPGDVNKALWSPQTRPDDVGKALWSPQAPAAQIPVLLRLNIL